MSPADAKVAVQSLFNDWYPKLLRYAWRSAGSLEQAEDVVQTAFLEYYKALSAGQSILHARAWLLCVAKRELLKANARRGREQSVAREVDWLNAVDVPVAEVAFAHDEMLQLLKVLTPREEEVVLLRLESMKYKDIANELGVTIPTVSTLLTRAVEKMRAVLGLQAEDSGLKEEGHAARRDY